MLLYDIFEYSMDGRKIMAGFDSCVPLYSLPAGRSDTLLVARNVNWDGHTLYGYDGSWRSDAPQPLQDAKRARNEEMRAYARASDAAACHAAGYYPEVTNGERRIYAQPGPGHINRTYRVADPMRQDIVAAACPHLQGDPALLPVYRHIVRIFGW